jgi:hypothetical protein
VNGKLIALYSSAPQSGKSEVAKALDSKVLKFAEPLKDMLRSLFRSVGYGETQIEAFLEGDQKDTPVPEFGSKTPRYLMQTLGTEWGRQLVSDSIWTDILAYRATFALAHGKHVVVDDMRFPNEFACLKSLGAKTVKVTRPGVVAKTNHRSEGLLDGYQFDEEIINDSDLSHLRDMTLVLIGQP